MPLYVKISRGRRGFYIESMENLAAAVEGEIGNSEEGDWITLTVVEMTEQNFDNMPEFEGWS